MAPEAAALLWDARAAALEACGFVQGRNFSDYLTNPMLSAAVERKLEIVGEALGQLRKVDAVSAAQIPELPAAVGLRNILIHAYGSVDNRLVWDVATAHLPELVWHIDRLLQQRP
jgi:uncharacterized protein with HEPN domain